MTTAIGNTEAYSPHANVAKIIDVLSFGCIAKAGAEALDIYASDQSVDRKIQAILFGTQGTGLIKATFFYMSNQALQKYAKKHRCPSELATASKACKDLIVSQLAIAGFNLIKTVQEPSAPNIICTALPVLTAANLLASYYTMQDRACALPLPQRGAL